MTATATLVVAVTLVVSGVALVLLTQQNLVSGLDAALLTRSQTVADQLRSSGGVTGTIQQPGGQAALVQVIDANGKVVAATANMRDGSEYENAVLSHPPRVRETTISTFTEPLLDSTSKFHVLAEPVTVAGRPGWIYAAVSLGPIDAATSSLVLVFAIGLPLVLLVVALTVWRAVAQALQPVELIRGQAAVIGAADLSQRVPVPRSRDEIGRLATTMNEMLDRLESAAIRQSQFIGDASHELRSPLAAMRAQVEVALAHPDPAESGRVLSVVLEQVERMSALTSDLLFLARNTEEQPKVLTTRVDVDELVLSELGRLRQVGGPAATLVRLDAIRVTGSKPDLSRVLRNLADNALDHAQSEVRISLIADGDFAEIVVVDDGPGIPEGARERVFERFTRLDDARVRTVSSGGFGLGLAIARRIIEAHSGTLSVGSRADGLRGAEFTVRLPIASE